MLNVNQLFYRIEKISSSSFSLLALSVDDVVVVVIMFPSHSWPESRKKFPLFKHFFPILTSSVCFSTSNK